MARVDTENVLELAAAEDQQRVEALVPEGSYPALGMRVRIRRSDRCSDDLDAFALEDAVEKRR
jgi:hypothetical protein